MASLWRDEMYFEKTVGLGTVGYQVPRFDSDPNLSQTTG